MADIPALANVAVQIFRSGNATGWKSAARQAVKRSGVSHKPDVEHIASEVCHHLQMRSTAVKKSKKRRKQQGIEETEINREPRQLVFRF